MDDVGSNRSFLLVHLTIKFALSLVKKKPEEAEEVFPSPKERHQKTVQIYGRKGAFIRKKDTIRKQLFGS